MKNNICRFALVLGLVSFTNVEAQEIVQLHSSVATPCWPWHRRAVVVDRTVVVSHATPVVERTVVVRPHRRWWLW